MSICTATEVWDFMGTEESIRTNQSTMMCQLIERVQGEIEKEIGRKLESQTLTDRYLVNGQNCDIFGSEIFLTGVIRDTYSISSLFEEGEELEESVAYDDDKDWVLDTMLGVIKKLDGWWVTYPNSIKITGKYGLVNQSDDSVDKGIKNLFIKWVAAESGYWKYNGEANGESFTTVVTKVPKDVKAAFMAKKEVDISV